MTGSKLVMFSGVAIIKTLDLPSKWLAGGWIDAWPAVTVTGPPRTTKGK